MAGWLHNLRCNRTFIALSAHGVTCTSSTGGLSPRPFLHVPIFSDPCNDNGSFFLGVDPKGVLDRDAAKLRQAHEVRHRYRAVQLCHR